MKPSAVIFLVLIVAVIVALISYNLGLAIFLILLLLAGVVTKLLRMTVQPPGEPDSESECPRR
jgi:hypothetical protein